MTLNRNSHSVCQAYNNMCGESEDANDYVNIRRRVRKFLKGNNEMRFGGVTSQEDS